MSAQRGTDRVALLDLAETLQQKLETRRPQLYYDLLRSTDPAQQALNRDPNIQLMFIDDNGMPKYYQINNVNAAKTVSTFEVWPGGSSGHNLTGAGTASNEFAIWDAGGVLLTHQEFGGRVTQADGASTTHYHATHVAGTMAAGGFQADAKGMSYQANLSAYDWTNDETEMATAAANGLQVSNHSYSFAGGWRWSGSAWYWYGDLAVSTVEDYTFGFYDSGAQDRDEIAYNAPNYLIVLSAGNDRDDAGPGPGGGHYHWNGGWVWATDTHDPDGGATGHDCLPNPNVAKNILTVGAVNDIPGGYSDPSDVVLTDFSSWGPADDGRVKPDIVANGASLYSPIDASNSSYDTFSGTSMSSPNVTGSVNLLIRHYEDKLSATPRSATMKAIVIHTADEAGSAYGPDYEHGWGLLNTETAANVIAADTLPPQHIIEDNLVTSTQDNHNFTVATAKAMRVTIVWTDPEGTPPPASLDPSTPMLVNDLDLTVQHFSSGTTYYPWRLDRLNPANAATQGDNSVDNVEVVDIPCAEAGLYIATVSHKGSLSSGSQDYSLVWSEGPVSEPICRSVPSSLDFGVVDLFDSQDLSFTLTNPRVCDTLSGTISESCTDYSIVSGGGGYTLAPGESLVVSVRFSPTVLGTRNCTVSTGTDYVCDVSCTGIGVEPPPECTLQPDTLHYGDVSVGGFAQLSFDIVNTGYGTLNGSVSATCDHFLLISGAGGYSLTHDQVHSVSVAFIPGGVGPDSCTVETGSGLCADVLCEGVGTSPAACLVQPDSLHFGTVLVGSSKDTTFTIRNTGGGVLNGDVSETCSHYSIISGGGAYALAASESLVVTVRYAPTSNGEHSCTVETGSGLCSDVACTGTAGIPAVCLVDPDSLHFGDVTIVDSLDMSFIVTNTGGDTLIGDISEVCDHYSVVSGAGPFSLAGSETLTVSVRFKPTSLGPHDCTIDTGDPICIDVGCTGTGTQPTGTDGSAPLTFALGQNFPNPFNPTTTISFAIPERVHANLSVYDLSGGLVRTLVDDVLSVGVKEAVWDGRDARGNPVSSGVYFYRLKAGDKVMTKKMVLLK